MRWELLDRFLRDACDEVERAEVLSWAAESARHRQILDDLAAALRATADAPSVQAEWERLRRALEAGPGPDDAGGPGPS